LPRPQEVKWHSVVAGIVAIVCGLPLTGLLFLGFRASWKGNDDSGAPVETRRDDGCRNIPITLIDSLHTSLNFAHHQHQLQHEIKLRSSIRPSSAQLPAPARNQHQLSSSPARAKRARSAQSQKQHQQQHLSVYYLDKRSKHASFSLPVKLPAG
jgi:hypothetical protein